MKKLLGTLFAATLVLSACSQDDTKKDENKKSESTTEKKADDKKDKKTKEDKKSKEEKKSQENEGNKSTQEDNSTEEQDTQETATNEQAQSQQQTQQPATQEQQQTQQAQQNSEYDSTKHSDEYNASHPVSTDDDWTPEMIEENERLNKEMEANAKVAKENGYTGIPNGDVGGVPTPDKYYSNDQLDPDTGLPKEDAVPHDVE
ncbi:flagellar biosynthesis GTPase FlhF [Staphylococcus hominis]